MFGPSWPHIRPNPAARRAPGPHLRGFLVPQPRWQAVTPPPRTGLRLREDDAGAQRQQLLRLLASLRQAGHMVGQLLQMSRLEPDNGQAIEMETVDVAALAREVALEWAAAAHERRADLAYEGVQALPVWGNRALLRELLNNLLDNALRYAGRDAVVTVAAVDMPDACLQVRDSGPGIPEAERDKVWLRFYRPAGERSEGSGLGLAIVKEIADKHDATITISDAIALHAGELWLGLVPPPDLAFHIREAIEIAGARRIGHGVALAFERDMEGLLAEMRARPVVVEVNLTSTDIILGVRGKDHPLPTYLAAGVPVVLSSDDAGVSRIDLTNEYMRAARDFGLEYRALKAIARNALIYSFLDEAQKRDELARFDHASAEFERSVASRQSPLQNAVALIKAAVTLPL